jgi:hypothetical protein
MYATWLKPLFESRTTPKATNIAFLDFFCGVAKRIEAHHASVRSLNGTTPALKAKDLAKASACSVRLPVEAFGNTVEIQVGNVPG